MPSSEEFLIRRLESSQEFATLNEICAECLPLRYPPQYFEKLAKDTTQDLVVLGAFSSCSTCSSSKPMVGVFISSIESPSELGRKKGTLLVIAVKEEERGKGIATQLLNRGIEHLLQKEPSLEELQLHVQKDNSEAYAFYQKHKFRFVRASPGHYRGKTLYGSPDAHLLSLKI